MVTVDGLMKSRTDWGNRQGNSARCFLYFLNEINDLVRYFESHQPPQKVVVNQLLRYLPKSVGDEFLVFLGKTRSRAARRTDVGPPKPDSNCRSEPTWTSSQNSFALPLQPRSMLCRVMCKELHMATNLSLDPELLDRALEVSGERTKKAAVTRALEEFIARRGQKRLVDLMGKLEWDKSFDYKAERSRR